MTRSLHLQLVAVCLGCGICIGVPGDVALAQERGQVSQQPAAPPDDEETGETGEEAAGPIAPQPAQPGRRGRGKQEYIPDDGPGLSGPSQARPEPLQTPSPIQIRMSPDGKPPLAGSAKRGYENPRDWIATINLIGTIGCTGTLIGPQVLLTAAHCIERRSTVPVGGFVNSQQVIIMATCQMHPMYRSNSPISTFDYALCHLRSPYPMMIQLQKSNGSSQEVDFTDPIQMRFERLSLDEPRRRPIGELVLGGFGCSSVASAALDGQFRAGYSSVTAASRTVMQLGGPRAARRGVLCAGDSGGAAYLPLTKDPYGRRVIVGVNSASYTNRRVSFLARTSAPTFRVFLNTWRRKWGMPKICGIDADVERLCHP